jgi:LPS O-antigen subunit length determinant protein (WzzB/FepE family)
VRDAAESKTQLLREQLTLKLQQEQQQKSEKAKQDKLKLLQQQLKMEQLKKQLQPAQQPLIKKPSPPNNTNAISSPSTNRGQVCYSLQAFSVLTV